MLESVMKLIAAQFGPDCEVVLHDWSKEYESTIVAIENGHVSGRKVGDGGSNLGLEVMRGTTDGSNQLNYITQTQDGRMLRSSSLYLTDENGKKMEAVIPEPASAATIAAAVKLHEDGVIGDDDRVVCVLTGSGLRDLKLFNNENADIPSVKPGDMDSLKQAVEHYQK